jgi:uncharacterized protein
MWTNLNNYVKASLFYGLAVGFAVLLALFASQLNAEQAGILNMFTPLLAVLLLLLVVTRDGYGKGGWLTLGLHRAGWQSWGLAVVGPLLVLSVTYGIVWATGLGRLVWPADQSSVDLLLNLVSNLIFGVLFGLSEEIGFRGYLLPHLMAMGRTRALLLSGFLHGVWHLPIMLMTPYYHNEGNPWIVVPLFLLTLTMAGVFYGYLRLTSESTWPAAIAHGTLNTLWNQFSMLTVAVGSPLLLEYLAGESGLLTLIGTAVLAGWLLYRLEPVGERAEVRPFVRQAEA